MLGPSRFRKHRVSVPSSRRPCVPSAMSSPSPCVNRTVARGGHPLPQPGQEREGPHCASPAQTRVSPARSTLSPHESPRLLPLGSLVGLVGYLIMSLYIDMSVAEIIQLLVAAEVVWIVDSVIAVRFSLPRIEPAASWRPILQAAA